MGLFSPLGISSQEKKEYNNSIQNMPLELIFLLFVLISFPIVGMAVVFLVKKGVDQERCLDKVHLQILIPRKDSDADAKQDTSKDFKDYIGLMEQLLTAMSSLYSGKFINKLRGQHTFSLEYIAYQNQLYFHMVVPRNYQ